MASENNDTQDGEIKKGNHNSFEAQVQKKGFQPQTNLIGQPIASSLPWSYVHNYRDCHSY